MVKLAGGMETPHAQPPVRSYRFAELLDGWPDTAASLPLVIYHDAIDAGQEAVSHRHGDFFSLYFVRQGRGTHWIDGVPYGVARGDVYAMGLERTHWFHAGNQGITGELKRHSPVERNVSP